MRILFTHFARSRSGLIFLMYAAFSAVISAGIAYAFHRSSVDSFRSHKAEEKITALRLVDAFVTTYSGLRSQIGPGAPVPATFRAHSIESFNQQVEGNGELVLRWVGREGRQIATRPADADMAHLIESFAGQSNPAPLSALMPSGGHLVFRTVYPSLAREQSCVTCHNQLQPDKAQWQINDVMGAFVIDVPAEAFLHNIFVRSWQTGLGLFFLLTAVGLAISILHFRQIRERESAALEARVQTTRLDAALRNMGDGLCMFDAQKRLVVCNDQYAQMYRLPAELLEPGTPHKAIIAHRVLNGVLTGETNDNAVDQKLTALDQLSEEATSSRIDALADGRLICVTRQPMTGGGWVATHQDITEQRRSAAKIAHMALHDTLTGLANRVLLNERLELALAGTSRGEIVAVHILDLDRFKHVNDTLGHVAGDLLLQTVAARLRALVRETDTVARMGGDEFAIVQVSLSQVTDATALAERAIAALCEPFDIDGQQVVIGTSVGIAMGPSDGTNAEVLIRNADLALYRAKGDGRGTFRFFESEMDAQMQARRALERDLRKALPAGEFELHYQPVVDLATDAISGFEALIRWRHPERGLVAPGEFIPLAEEIGFIVPLGEWTLREACTTAAQWPADLKVAVNLSPAQFRTPNLLPMIVNALAASGLAASRLELEITETILLQDSEATLDTLNRLRALGVRIAMDDFGTGYSSLSYLQSFPFDKIKIDRSFIKDIAESPSSLNIVRAIAALANGLGVAATAEGVETKEQLDMIKSEGCTEMQGFLLSKPLPAHELEQFFPAQRKSRSESGDSVAA